MMNQEALAVRQLASRWLLNLCRVDSTTGQEDALLAPLQAILVELQANVEIFPVVDGRCNVLATWGEPRVLFSTHLDTVPPFIAPVVEAGVIYGRGACDAKGQIVAQLLAVRSLLASGIRQVAWLGVIGEESDAAGARAALELEPRFAASRVLINGEPTELTLAAGQRGVQHLRLTCLGRSAHSGTPEAGHSALWSLLDWLQRLRQKPRPVDKELGPEIWNLGLLQGGEAINVISARATADLLARTLPESGFLADVQATRPPEGQVEEVYAEPPARFPELPGFSHRPVTFGSDAVTLRRLIPDETVVLAGPGSISVAHTVEEHLSLDELQAGADLNERLAVAYLAETLSAETRSAETFLAPTVAGAGGDR